MSKRAARFTEADIRRAVRAVVKEAAPMAVEVAPDGTIRIVPYAAPPAPNNDAARKDSTPKPRIRL
jgi:hypothetical protein